MKPIGNYILINIIEEEIETSSGLILSGEEANQLRYKKAEIIEVGTDVLHISKGDTIYYDSRAGYTMMINTDTCTLIRESDVVVVL